MGGVTARPAVFLDKDGTLIVDVPYNVDPARIELAPGAASGLPRLHRAGWLLVVVSNQSGVARGIFPESALSAVEARLRAMLAGFDVPLAGFYYCPHRPDDGCLCRKPGDGLLRRAAEELGLALAASWMVGDILSDVEAGRRAGCRTVLVDNGNETEWQLTPVRTPDFRVRDLAEAAEVILGASGPPPPGREDS